VTGSAVNEPPPAAAQNVAQDAKSLLQAADKAIGASGVNSVTYSGSSTMRYPGQSFGPNDDWPRAPMTAHTATIDYGSKSSKEDFMVEVPKRNAAAVLPSRTASTLSAAITPGT
jgi:hypothetical protein